MRTITAELVSSHHYRVTIPKDLGDDEELIVLLPKGSDIERSVQALMDQGIMEMSIVIEKEA